jgi:steroid 5-alpha reductase family enzyme
MPPPLSTPLRSALRLSALTVAGVNAAGFAVTAATHTHAVTDLAGTSAFVASAWATHAAAAAAGGVGLFAPTRGFALTAVVTAWGVRLGGYLFSRVLRTGGDARLDPFFPRKKGDLPLKLAGFWLAQAAWGWLCMLPVTAAHALLPPRTRVGPGAALALAAAAGALGVQAAADSQKAAWKKEGGQGPLMTGKLFEAVQYPNYAAEVAFWTAVTAAAGPAVVAAAPAVLASPAASALLLSKVSGVPPLERDRRRRYGGSPAYRAYAESTPRMLPRWAGGRGPGPG